MTHKEAVQKYIEFRDTYNGKYLDYDGSYGCQCWDLAQMYFVKYLGVPDWVLGGCGLVSNMLYPPKLNDLLQYFDEVPLNEMDTGDVIIWEYGHIAVLDHYDGKSCWYFSQNPNPCQVMVINREGQHAFRLKTKNPEPVDYKEKYEEALKEIDLLKQENKYLQDKIDKAIKDLS